MRATTRATRTRLTSLLIATLTTVTALGVGTAAAASNTIAAKKPAPFATALDTSVPKVMQENAIPGSVVYVISPKGTYRKTFGTAVLGDTVPLQMQDSFRIGSNTKTMTVTVIMQLVQEGKLKLDDPISKFVQNTPDGDNITIAQLAEMRSGLFSYTFDPAFNVTIDNEPQKAWTPDELLGIAFAHPNNFAPGTQFEYSNTNLVLLGVVIEKLTGMSARDAFAQRIDQPLRLKPTQLP